MRASQKNRVVHISFNNGNIALTPLREAALHRISQIHVTGKWGKVESPSAEIRKMGVDNAGS